MNDGAYFDNDTLLDDNIKNISVRSIEKSYTGEGMVIDLELRPETKLPDGSRYTG